MGASKELRAFIARTGIEVNLVYELVDVDRNPPELRQYPKAQTKSQGQIQMALLSALLSLLSGGGLEVDASAVRETCRSLGYYDEANFAANFKKHSGLFTGPVKMGQPARRLSLEGERQLAQLVRDLVSEFGRGA
ncbi:MAG TPA: hypothetical protein VMG98_04605 [Verrucomicrobiae bacterium]|nr:hypothetical protein [Verrucomicrobiae bacterium]